MTELRIYAGTVDWSSLEDERSLIERAKEDPKAFAALYRQHYPAIARYVYRRTGDGHVTEDLVSEVFLSALRHLSRYRHRGVPIRYWLYRIATHAVNQWVRRRKPRLRRDGSVDLDLQIDPGNADEEQAGTREFAQHAILQLSPKHQVVLSLHYFEGMSIEEVSAVIGCRPGTVKSRLSRAREALRHKLDGWR